MPLNYQSLEKSEIYQKEKSAMTSSGKKRGLKVLVVIALLVVPLLWPLAIFIAIKSFGTNAKRGVALENFAHDNKFTFEKVKTGFVSAEDRTELTVGLPYAVRSITHVQNMSGVFKDHSFSYSIVMVERAAGKKSNASGFPVTVFKIELPLQFPRVFIDSKRNDMGTFDLDADNFEEHQDHHLEGDFNQHYTVRIQKGTHIDMYRILTPEVMDTLKRNDYFDIWLENNQMTLITTGHLDVYLASVPAVFEITEKLMKEIDLIARTLRQKKI